MSLDAINWLAVIIATVVAFLIGAVILIVLTAVALIQYGLRSRRTAGNAAND